MKERIVPVGQAAVEAISRYVDEDRPKVLRGPTEILFLSRTGKQLTRMALWNLVRRYVKQSGLINHVSPTSCGTASPPI